jgi:short subunit fatty acids transporter
VVQSAFQDERVMPFNKKATGINIIVLVSKSITIGAPFVNELEEPIPIIVIIVLAILSIAIVMFFKSKEELDQMKKIDPQSMMSAASKKDENEKLIPVDKLQNAMEDVMADNDTDKED